MVELPSNSRYWSRLKHFWREIKWAALGIFWLLSLSLGYFGFTFYTRQYNLPYSVIDRVYLSLQLISMNSGAVEGDVNWMLQIARFVVPALAAFTAFQALINLFHEQTQWLHLWRIHDHIIVCGLGRKGSFLINHLLNSGCRLVAIDNKLDSALVAEYRHKGVIIIQGDATDPDTLARARVSRASHLICFLGDEQQNINIALQAQQFIHNQRRNDLVCVLYLVSEDLINFVKKSELNLNKDDPFTYEIFNIYKNIAHSLVDHISAQRKTLSNLLIVGMGRLGKNIILEAAYQYFIFNATKPLQITVIDRDAEHKLSDLIQDYPQLTTVCEFTSIQVDVSSNGSLTKALNKNEDKFPFGQIFICLGDPILSIRATLTLLSFPNLSNSPVFIRMERSSGLFNLVENPTLGLNAKHCVTPFDIYEQTCSTDLVFGGIHELLSHKLRENYIKSLEPEQAKQMLDIPWSSVSEEEKEANRQQAKRICHLLKSQCYDLKPLNNWAAAELTFEPEEVQNMAQMEHALWCEWKRSEGWQYGKERNNEKKVHPALIPWDELPKDDQEKNIQFIIRLPALLAELGFQIEKIK